MVKYMKHIILIFLIINVVSAEDWLVETVDSEGDLGDFTHISVDILNNPHITYRQVGVDVKYAKWQGAWLIETLPFDEAGRWTIDISLDAFDIIPHISYWVSASNELRHYKRVSTSAWEYDVIENGITVDMSRIVVDKSNNIHVIYSDSSGNLKYAKGVTVGTSTTWYKESVTTGVSSRTIDLSIDSSKQPHIVFKNINTNRPMYGFKSGSTWQIGEVNTDTVTSQRVSIAVDRNNTVHICYQSNNSLRYVKGTYGSLSSAENIDSGAGKYISIAIDNNNITHIAYYDETNKSLKYAKYKSGTWFTQTVDGGSADVGKDCAIAVGSDGIPQISYYDATNKDLKFAKVKTPPPPDDSISLKLINNVFNPKKGEYMNIQYTLSIPTNIDLKIFNVVGDLVREVTSGYQLNGNYVERWYGDDTKGNTVPSGMYLVILKSNKYKIVKKAVVVK